MANNRNQAHISEHEGRTEIAEYTNIRIYENDNEEIDPNDVVESLIKIVNSSVNLVDDNVDLRQGITQDFLFSNTVVNGINREFTLAQSAVNPDDGSGVLVLEGCKLSFGTDFLIVGNKVSFEPNSDMIASTKFTVKYKYYETPKGS